MKARYVQRHIEAALRRTARQFPALALTGPRQSGKTTTLRHLFGRTHRVLTFDDLITRERALTDPALFLERAGERVLLDEIQYVPELLPSIKLAIDAAPHRPGRFVLSGSQQFPLIRGLGETLAGRIALLQLLPFSAAEMIQARPTLASSPRRLFVEACLRGAFPAVALRPSIEAAIWYGSYMQTYLERDVRAIHGVGSLREFQQFLRLLAARCAQPLQASDLARDLGVAVNTVRRWISVLEASQILFLLPPHFRNLGKRIVKRPKVYFLDCGLVTYLTGVETESQLLHGPLAGPLFENYVVQETVKVFANRGATPRLSYLRTHNGLEVDMLVEAGGRIHPVEIKLTGSPSPGLAGPLDRFREIFHDLAPAPGRIVCLKSEPAPLTRDIHADPPLTYLDWLTRL